MGPKNSLANSRRRVILRPSEEVTPGVFDPGFLARGVYPGDLVVLALTLGSFGWVGLPRGLCKGFTHGGYPMGISLGRLS